jgi:hypothetical protein
VISSAVVAPCATKASTARPSSAQRSASGVAAQARCPAAARFARANVDLYIESVYDAHFTIAQLGKLVVAEGIEREEQAARLREYGCTLGQGFLFSRPIEADEMRERLTADAALLV